MKRKLTPKDYVMYAAVFIPVVLIINYLNPFGYIFSKIRGSDSASVAGCVNALKNSGGSEIAFMFTFMGIAEDKTQAALDDYMLYSCECFVKEANGDSPEVFLSNPDNKPKLDGCTQTSIAKIQEKHGDGAAAVDSSTEIPIEPVTDEPLTEE